MNHQYLYEVQSHNTTLVLTSKRSEALGVFRKAKHARLFCLCVDTQVKHLQEEK